MSLFSKIDADSIRKPPAMLVLTPSFFATEWPGRPDENVCIGLRIVPENEKGIARSEAAREAWNLHPRDEDRDNRIDAMNDILMRWIIARSACDPNDADRAPELWAAAPEDLVKEALSTEGTKAIFDAIDRLEIENSPVVREATDEEIDEVLVVSRAALAEMSPTKAKRVRRLLGVCLDELIAALPGRE